MRIRALLGLVFFFLLSGNLLAMDNPYRLLTTAELPDFYAKVLPGFWHQHAIPGEFSGQDNVPIRYVALRNPASHKAILVVNGRVESYIKYQELAYELFQQGYSVYLYDHRGQGFSGRMLSDPQKGYVHQFSDYVADLKQFHDQVVSADQPTQLYLLAHSMGGAISAEYLRQYPNDFRAAVLSAPMFGIQLGAMPQWLARFVVWIMDLVTQLFGVEAPYAPGQHGYDPYPFAGNDLTHDATRYARFRSLYHDYPEVQLGGPTTTWIGTSLAAADKAVEAGQLIRTPLLLMQAGADSIVRTDRQDSFCQRMSVAGNPCEGGQPLRFEGARHELLNESDDFRIPALSATLDFFARNQ